MAIDWNDPATWQALYQIRIRDPDHPQFGQVVSGMTRFIAGRMMGPLDDDLTLFVVRRDRLIAQLGIQTADRILVVGCGFGYLIEVFRDAGYLSTYGLDSSTHISNNRPTEGSPGVVVVEDDVRAGGRVKARLRQQTGDDVFTWVISEDVATGYDDAELPPLLDAAESVLASGLGLDHVVHIVTTVEAGETTGDSMVNWKSLAAWNALRPAHTWTDAMCRRFL